jgi:hypothetical protein
MNMKSARYLVPAIALATLVACNDSTSADGLFDDEAVTEDVAVSAGDAVATMLSTMIGNEATAAGGAEAAGGAAAGDVSSSISIDRSRTCYDVNGAEVTNCKPFASVRMIATAASITGTRSATRTNRSGGTVTWTGTVDRSANDTTRRIFDGATETSRVHTNVGVGSEVTTVTDGLFTRTLSEAVRDSVIALTFNLPHASNPLPISGSIVRRSTASVEVTKEDQHVSRDVSHRIEVVFPADAQGNVTLHIDSKTCQLNLFTHAVTSCE